MDRLKNVMWNMFQDTGNIDAYLFYCGCDEAELAAEAAELRGEQTLSETGYKN